jgi:CheY-like chemotaxis protein
MVRNVLFVDDDLEMLQALKEGLEKYGDTFTALLAQDGQDAVEKLKQHTVSLVVTDLKMPRMDGFSLLAYIMEYYPDIPVIIITGYSTAEMKRLAQEGGAVGYISKPFLIEDLAHQIMKTLRKESDGGTLHSVSSGMFLQLMEMEERTCTIRLIDKASGKGGVLFFHNGELMNARVEQLKGIEAAYRIFAWDEVTLSIQNECPVRENVINSDLQPIILEAARLKDEAESLADAPAAAEATAVPPPRTVEASLSSPIEIVRQLLQRRVGERCGLQDIYLDQGVYAQIAPFAALGQECSFGAMKLGYFDRGDNTDAIILPGEPCVVIKVNPRCPRDKIIQVLSSEG